MSTKSNAKSAAKAEASIVDRSLTYVGEKLVTVYAVTTHTAGQISTGVQQCVVSTPDIFMAGRASAEQRVSNILAKYKK